MTEEDITELNTEIEFLKLSIKLSDDPSEKGSLQEELEILLKLK